LHIDALIEADFGVGAQNAIGLDQALPALIGIGRHRPRYRRALASNLYDIANPDAKPLQILGIHARQPAPDILG
jgi:hypothetical protein